MPVGHEIDEPIVVGDADKLAAEQRVVRCGNGVNNLVGHLQDEGHERCCVQEFFDLFFHFLFSFSGFRPTGGSMLDLRKESPRAGLMSTHK